MNSIEIKENICFIAIDNRPHNYLLSPEFISTKKIVDVLQNSSVKAVILSGVGRHFSAGADRDQLLKMTKDGTLAAEITKGKKILQVLKNVNLPIIACIEGSCFGGGLELALHADIRIASTKSLFAFPETNLDLMPGLGGTIELPNIIGQARALEMILKGDLLDAQSALELELIDRLVSPKSTLESGWKLAQSMINDRSIRVIKAVVESIRNAKSLSRTEALQRETELFCLLAARAAKKL